MAIEIFKKIFLLTLKT